MNISSGLEAFAEFAKIMRRAGEETAVVGAVEVGADDNRRVELGIATDDGAAAAAANRRTRDIFFALVAGEFGGERRIPRSVMDVLANLGGDEGSPLTAQRIVAVCNAVIAAKEHLAEVTEARHGAATAGGGFLV